MLKLLAPEGVVGAEAEAEVVFRGGTSIAMLPSYIKLMVGIYITTQRGI